MELLTVRETAQLLRVNPITIRRYIADGRLPAVRVGRAVRVQREAIEHFTTPIEPKHRTGKLLPHQGKPTSADDPIWSIIGIAGDRDLATDISENKYKYLPDAYADTHE